MIIGTGNFESGTIKASKGRATATAIVEFIRKYRVDAEACLRNALIITARARRTVALADMIPRLVNSGASPVNIHSILPALPSPLFNQLSKAPKIVIGHFRV